MNRLTKTMKWMAANLEEVILVVLLAYMACCMILQIFMRHVMGASLSWSEESIRYVFIWMIFLGFGLAVKEDRHISITFFKGLLGEKFQFALTLLSNTVFFIYSCLMLVFGVQVVMDFIQSGQTSPSLGIPKYLVFLAAPIGFTLVMIRLIKVTIKAIRDFKMNRNAEKIGG
ncbi:MAG: TRAP transporter small permease [Firmicutes bacterium]|jgi:TRAP-type C4-dicarboxylate transport system permease small subunit|nr:TRAP transporter small permease [Bacillota bacterium]